MVTNIGSVMEDGGPTVAHLLSGFLLGVSSPCVNVYNTVRLQHQPWSHCGGYWYFYDSLK